MAFQFVMMDRSIQDSYFSFSYVTIVADVYIEFLDFCILSKTHYVE